MPPRVNDIEYVGKMLLEIGEDKEEE